MTLATSVVNSLLLHNLHKRFILRTGEVLALRDINLAIPAGEFACIVGSSGCGKSTLLRIISGLERDYEGEALFNGERITGPGTDRGVVFQEHRLFPWLTVRENVAFGVTADSSHEIRCSVDEYISLVGLAGFEKAYPHQLSGGMAQRASIARALVNRPKMLLLDEPFGSLDALTRIQMQQEILRIWKVERTTMIMVTHDIEEAIYLGDHVVIMSERPGTIRRIFPVDLPRPRDRGSLDFAHLRKEIYAEFFQGEEEPTFAFAI
jgi:sulfonate transport system ATP-binding protein